MGTVVNMTCFEPAKSINRRKKLFKYENQNSSLEKYQNAQPFTSVSHRIDRSNSVVFTVFTKLCNYHYLVPEHFHQPPTNPVTIRSHSSFHFLSLWNYLFCTIQINGLFPYVVFCFWLLSPSVMFIRFIHIVAGVSTSFPLMAE